LLILNHIILQVDYIPEGAYNGFGQKIPAPNRHPSRKGLGSRIKAGILFRFKKKVTTKYGIGYEKNGAI